MISLHRHYVARLGLKLRPLDLQSDVNWYSGGHGSRSQVQQHSFLEIGHEIISTAILSLPLIQEGQLSVIGKRMCTHLGLSLPRKSVVSLTGHLDMTIVVDWDVKQQTNWAPSWENLLLPYANNKGADQPAHPRSVISAFVICCLDSISSFYTQNFKSQASFSYWAGRFESYLVENP